MKKIKILSALTLSFAFLFLFGTDTMKASTCAPGTFVNGKICGSTIQYNGYFATSQNLLLTEQEAIMFGNPLSLPQVGYTTNSGVTMNNSSTKATSNSYTTTNNQRTSQGYDDYYEDMEDEYSDTTYRGNTNYDTRDDYYESSEDEYDDEYESYNDEYEYNSNKSNTSTTYKESSW